MKTAFRLFAALMLAALAGCAPASVPDAPTLPPVAEPPPSPFPTQRLAAPSPTSAPRLQTGIPIPPQGMLYHGVYPGGVTGEEDDLTPADLQSYEQAAGKRAVWVFFSNNWYRSRAFPLETASWIREAGSIPYVRLMLRSDPEGNRADPTFTLQNVLDGKFDDNLRAWCAAARDFGAPLLAEYGTEMNGDWFPWNGKWNGGGETGGYGDPSQPDGPERFRDAYRRIIQICRVEGAGNITWVFHVNADDWPLTEWNRFENYYPGDEWIDWVAVSVYGAQTPEDDYWDGFSGYMDSAYNRLQALAPQKPVIVAEFGATAGNPLGDQALWARAALKEMTSGRWPRLIGFSWWNEWWQNDDIPAHDTNMRLQDNPALQAVFQELVGGNDLVLERPILP